MKKSLIILVAFAMAFCLAICTLAAPAVSGSADVTDGGFAVSDSASLMAGDTLGLAPEDTIKAPQLIAVVAKLHSELNNGGLSDEDTADDYYAYAVNNGIIADGVFNDSSEPTRAQVVMALYNAVIGKIDLTAINNVLDIIDGDTSHEYYEKARAFMNAGIIYGYDQYGTFMATNSVKRYELGLMVDRLLNPSERVTKEYKVYSSAEPFYLIDDFLLDLGARGWLTGGSGWRIDYTGSTEVGTINNYANFLRDYAVDDNMSTTRRIHVQDSGELVFEAVYEFDSGDTLGISFLDFDDNVIATTGWKNGNAYAGTVTDASVTVANMKEPDQNPDVNQFNHYMAGKLRTRVVLDLDKGIYNVWMGKNKIGEDHALGGSNLAKVKFHTGIEEVSCVDLDNAHLWKNYKVNDVFRLENQRDEPIGYEVTPMVKNSSGEITHGVVVERFLANANNTGEVNSMKMVVTNGNTYAKRTFDKATGKVIAESYVLFDADISEAHYGGKEVTNSAYFTIKCADTAVVTVKNTGNKWYANGVALDLTTPGDKFTSNVWQCIRIEADTKTQKALIKINGKVAAENVPFLVKADGFDSLEVGVDATSDDVIYFDDIEVYETFVDLYDDYVPVPEPLDTTVNGVKYTLNMSVCNLWRNGSHYGWDWIRPFAELEPAIGYYDEGNPEAMDWEIKYLTEHGISNYMTCWYPTAQGAPLKKPRMIDAIHDGYFNAKYSDLMTFSLMYENSGRNEDKHREDFKNVVFPLWMDWYFSDPRYCRIKDGNNEYIFLTIYQHVMFLDMCSTDSLLSYNPETQGYTRNYSEDSTQMKNAYTAAQEMLNWMEEQIIEAGYADGLVVCFGGSINSDRAYREMASMAAESGTNAIYDSGIILYAWGKTAFDLNAQKSLAESHMASAKTAGIDMLTLATPGFNDIGWTSTRPGYMATNDFYDILKNFHKTRMDNNTLGYSKNWKKTFITFDTWNEYGEGHYLFPTKDKEIDENGNLIEGIITEDEVYSQLGYGGFGYLDAIAATFGGPALGTDAAKANNTYPTAKQKARVGTIYPDDLDHYIRRDMLVDEETPDNYIELGGWDFTVNSTNMNNALENSPGNWENKSSLSWLGRKDYFQYDSTNKCWYGKTTSNQATITLSDPEGKVYNKVNTDDVDFVYLKVGTSSGGATGKIYFTTSTDTNPGIQDEYQKLRNQYTTYAGASGTEYYIPVSEFDNWHGVIQGIRWDPCYKSGETVYLYALKFLAIDPESFKTNIYVDGQKYEHQDYAEVREQTRKEVYITATEGQGLYKLLHIVYNWNRSATKDEPRSKVLKLDTPNGTKFEFEVGSSTALVNGKAVALEKPFYLYDGAPVIPLIFILKNAGYNYTYDFTNKRLNVTVANKFEIVDGINNGDAEDLNDVHAFTGYNNNTSLPVTIEVDPQDSTNHAWKYTSGDSQAWNYISTPFDFVPGKTYTIDFDVYFDSIGSSGTAPSANGVISVNPRYSDTAGTISDHNTNIATESLTPKTWTHVTRTFTINDTYIAGTGQMSVYMNPSSGIGCTYYIDNFKLSTKPLPFKMLNGDAETAETAEQIKDKTEGFYIGNSVNNLTIEAESDGNHYWNIKSNETKQSWTYICQKTTFEKGVTYYYRVRAKLGADGSGANVTNARIVLNARYYDSAKLGASGEWYAHTQDLMDARGNNLYFNTTDGTWKQAYGSFTISQGYLPNGGPNKNIAEEITFFSNPVGNAGISFMIDDFEITTDPDVYASWKD